MGAKSRRFESFHPDHIKYKESNMFCGVCEKVVKTKIKETSNKRYWWNKKILKLSSSEIKYIRKVCCKCDSELLIEEGNYVNSKCERN